MDLHMVFETEWLHARRAFALTSVEACLDAFFAESMATDGKNCVFETIAAILAV
jgi:hypothetical protein